MYLIESYDDAVMFNRAYHWYPRQVNYIQYYDQEYNVILVSSMIINKLITYGKIRTLRRKRKVSPKK